MKRFKFDDVINGPINYWWVKTVGMILFFLLHVYCHEQYDLYRGIEIVLEINLLALACVMAISLLLHWSDRANMLMSGTLACISMSTLPLIFFFGLFQIEQFVELLFFMGMANGLGAMIILPPTGDEVFTLEFWFPQWTRRLELWVRTRRLRRNEHPHSITSWLL